MKPDCATRVWDGVFRIASTGFGKCFFLSQTTGPLPPRSSHFQLDKAATAPLMQIITAFYPSKKHNCSICKEHGWIARKHSPHAMQCASFSLESQLPTSAVPAIRCLRLWNRTEVQTRNFNCSHDYDFFLQKKDERSTCMGGVFSRPNRFWFHDGNSWLVHLDN